MFFVFTTVFTVDNSPRYYVAYTNDNGEEVRGRSFATKQEAEKFAAVLDNAYVLFESPLPF